MSQHRAKSFGHGRSSTLYTMAQYRPRPKLGGRTSSCAPSSRRAWSRSFAARTLSNVRCSARAPSSSDSSSATRACSDAAAPLRPTSADSSCCSCSSARRSSAACSSHTCGACARARAQSRGRQLAGWRHHEQIACCVTTRWYTQTRAAALRTRPPALPIALPVADEGARAQLRCAWQPPMCSTRPAAARARVRPWAAHPLRLVPNGLLLPPAGRQLRLQLLYRHLRRVRVGAHSRACPRCGAGPVPYVRAAGGGGQGRSRKPAAAAVITPASPQLQLWLPHLGLVQQLAPLLELCVCLLQLVLLLAQKALG